ncbi:hypothetical protein CHS0354_003814, partial [Potamilus streckersoni]
LLNLLGHDTLKDVKHLSRQDDSEKRVLNMKLTLIRSIYTAAILAGYYANTIHLCKKSPTSVRFYSFISTLNEHGAFIWLLVVPIRQILTVSKFGKHNLDSVSYDTKLRSLDPSEEKEIVEDIC